MSRFKGPYAQPYLLSLKRLSKGITRKNKATFNHFAWSRSSTILPIHLGLLFNIHNGITFIKKKITYQMIGHKFGEFANTRTIRIRGKT